MMRLAVVVLCVAVAFAAPLSSDLDEEWSAFKSVYNKNYNQNDEIIRRLVWENNLKYIQKHNMEADRGLHSYRLGVNEYVDLTNEEFVKQMNGYKMVNRTVQGANFLPPSNVGAPPTSVDWRTKGYVTGVKNQLECGSCWAFSSTGSLEGQHFKKSGTLVSLSEQNLVDCSKKEGNHGCGGGLMDYAFQYIKVNKGLDTETSYPYEAKDDKCRFRKTDVGATDTGFMDITPRKSETALQEAVATVGPISVAIDASHPSFRMYKSGVYDEPACSQTMLDHGVLAVGYGSEQGTDYWIVKNSWGLSWGDKGYIKMSRNKDNQCGIASMASYPLV